MNVTLVVIVLAVIGVGWAVLTYNRLVRLQVRAEEAWRGIDTQLKRRWDLIPQLTEVVRGYAGHEQSVFERVAVARQRSMSVATPRDQAYAEQGLKEELRSLYAVVENYPDLRANRSFLELGETLEQIEDTIQRSRRVLQLDRPRSEYDGPDLSAESDRPNVPLRRAPVLRTAARRGENLPSSQVLDPIRGVGGMPCEITSPEPQVASSSV